MGLKSLSLGHGTRNIKFERLLDLLIIGFPRLAPKFYLCKPGNNRNATFINGKNLYAQGYCQNSTIKNQYFFSTGRMNVEGKRVCNVLLPQKLYVDILKNRCSDCTKFFHNTCVAIIVSFNWRSTG